MVPQFRGKAEDTSWGDSPRSQALEPQNQMKRFVIERAQKGRGSRRTELWRTPTFKGQRKEKKPTNEAE